MKPHKAIAFFTVALLWAVVSPAVAQEALTADCPQVTGKYTFSLYLSRVTCSPQWTALELRSYDSPGNVVHISPGSFLKGLSTEKEYRLLRLMLLHRGKLFSAQNLYESVWEEPYLPASSNTVMVHIRRIREKMHEQPRNPKFIKTVWGMGYKIEK